VYANKIEYYTVAKQIRETVIMIGAIS